MGGSTVVLLILLFSMSFIVKNMIVSCNLTKTREGKS